MKPRWTPAIFRMMNAAADADTARVSGQKRTIIAAMDRGWVEPVRGWVEAPAGRYHRRARATEQVWGVVGYRMTSAGAVAVANERHRRKHK